MSKNEQTDSVRILLINQTFYPDPPATSLYLTPLAEKLTAMGHEVTVLTSRRAYDDTSRLYPAHETWHGIEIVRVWSTGLGYGAKWHRGIDFLSFFVAAAFRGLFMRRADLVLAQTSPPLISVLGAILAGLWGGRFIYWVMDLNPDEAVAVGWLQRDGLAARFLEAVSRWVLRRADRVIVQDRFVRERLKAKEVPEEKIEVIPLWIHDEAAFDAAKREQFRREHNLEEKYVVMFAGNHTPCHPLDMLMAAARLLRSDSRIHFCFIGFGIDWAGWRDRAKWEGWANTTFLGHQPLSSGVISAADSQVVVMGEPFVGIVHACKIYNIMAARRPFIYLGPEPSHVTDIIREAGLESFAASIRHGEGQKMADEIRGRAYAQAGGKAMAEWPAGARFDLWSEKVVLEKMILALGLEK